MREGKTRTHSSRRGAQAAPACGAPASGLVSVGFDSRKSASRESCRDDCRVRLCHPQQEDTPWEFVGARSGKACDESSIFCTLCGLAAAATAARSQRRAVEMCLQVGHCAKVNLVGSYILVTYHKTAPSLRGAALVAPLGPARLPFPRQQLW